MILRLKIFLNSRDQEDQYVAIFIDKECTCEIANALDEDIFTLSEINCMNV